MGDKDQIQVQYVEPKNNGSFHEIYFDNDDKVVVRQLRNNNFLDSSKQIMERVKVLSKSKAKLVYEHKILPEFEPYNTEQGWMTVARGTPMQAFKLEHINMFCDFVMRFETVSERWALEDAKRDNFLIMCYGVFCRWEINWASE